MHINTCSLHVHVIIKHHRGRAVNGEGENMKNDIFNKIKIKKTTLLEHLKVKY